MLGLHIKFINLELIKQRENQITMGIVQCCTAKKIQRDIIQIGIDPIIYGGEYETPVHANQSSPSQSIIMKQSQSMALDVGDSIFGQDLNETQRPSGNDSTFLGVSQPKPPNANSQNEGPANFIYDPLAGTFAIKASDVQPASPSSSTIAAPSSIIRPVLIPPSSRVVPMNGNASHNHNQQSHRPYDINNNEPFEGSGNDDMQEESKGDDSHQSREESKNKNALSKDQRALTYPKNQKRGSLPGSSNTDPRQGEKGSALKKRKKYTQDVSGGTISDPNSKSEKSMCGSHAIIIEESEDSEQTPALPLLGKGDSIIYKVNKYGSTLGMDEIGGDGKLGGSLKIQINKHADSNGPGSIENSQSTPGKSQFSLLPRQAMISKQNSQNDRLQIPGSSNADFQNRINSLMIFEAPSDNQNHSKPPSIHPDSSMLPKEKTSNNHLSPFGFNFGGGAASNNLNSTLGKDDFQGRQITGCFTGAEMKKDSSNLQLEGSGNNFIFAVSPSIRGGVSGPAFPGLVKEGDFADVMDDLLLNSHRISVKSRRTLQSKASHQLSSSPDLSREQSKRSSQNQSRKSFSRRQPNMPTILPILQMKPVEKQEEEQKHPPANNKKVQQQQDMFMRKKTYTTKTKKKFDEDTLDDPPRLPKIPQNEDDKQATEKIIDPLQEVNELIQVLIPNLPKQKTVKLPIGVRLDQFYPPRSPAAPSNYGITPTKAMEIVKKPRRTSLLQIGNVAKIEPLREISKTPDIGESQPLSTKNTFLSGSRRESQQSVIGSLSRGRMIFGEGKRTTHMFIEEIPEEKKASVERRGGLLGPLRMLTTKLGKDYDKIDHLLDQKINSAQHNQVIDAIYQLNPDEYAKVLAKEEEAAMKLVQETQKLDKKKIVLRPSNSTHLQDQNFLFPQSAQARQRGSLKETHKKGDGAKTQDIPIITSGGGHQLQQQDSSLHNQSQQWKDRRQSSFTQGGEPFNFGYASPQNQLANGGGRKVSGQGMLPQIDSSQLDETEQISEFLKRVPQENNISDDESDTSHISVIRTSRQPFTPAHQRGGQMHANTPNNNGYGGAGYGFNDTKSNNDLGVSIEYSVMEHYNVNKSVYGANNDDTISGYGAKSEFVAQSPKPGGGGPVTIDIQSPQNNLLFLNKGGSKKEEGGAQLTISPLSRQTPTGDPQQPMLEKQSKSFIAERRPLPGLMPKKETPMSPPQQKFDPNVLTLPMFPPKKPGAPQGTGQNSTRAQGGSNPMIGGQEDDDNISMFSKVSHSVISTKMKDGKKKINQYIVMKEIGKGAFGKVKLVLDTEDNNKQYAMKTVKKENKMKAFLKGKGKSSTTDVHQEIAIMKKLNHVNVVRLVEVLDDATCDKLYIIMELVKNGSVLAAIQKNKNIDLMTLWRYFRDMVSGLHYLHETCGIVHRDIKPENLLIDDQDRVKFTDFGLSVFTAEGNEWVNNQAGSQLFFAPEITLNLTYNTKAADIWALGVTLYFMFFKDYPFTARNKQELFPKIQTQEVIFPADANEQLVNLLRGMLTKDPEKRMTLKDIACHPWVTLNGLQPLPIRQYSPIVVAMADKLKAIGKVATIELIRIRMKKRVEELRSKLGVGTLKGNNNDNQSKQEQQQQ